MPDLSTIIAEREKTHGRFADVAVAHRAIVGVLADAMNARGRGTRPVHFSAMDMIAMKLARIVCGDANFAEHWLDIEGYAHLARLHTPTDADQHEEGTL